MSVPKYFRGEWLEAGDPGYDQAGGVFNLKFDAVRPAVIARCLGNTDVSAALAYAREEGLPVAVRATGYSMAGFSATTGLMIDLSLMRNIRIDRDTATAWIGGGVNGGDLQIEAFPYGLAAAMGGLSSTGAGLVLAGGIGSMPERVGYSAESVLAVELVTADGRVVVASKDQNPDLFWAVRGAGANFGVVTSLQLQLHEVHPTIAAGWVFYRPERTREALENFRAMAPTVSDDVHMLNIVSPEGVQLWINHVGTEAEAEAEVARFLRDCPPDEDHRSRMSLRELIHLYDDDFPRQAVEMMDEHYEEITDEMLDIIVERIQLPLPEGSTAVRQIEVAVRQGAIIAEPGVPSVVHPAATERTWAVIPGVWWRDLAETEGEGKWREESHAALVAVGPTTGRAIPSYVGVPATEEVVARVYGDQLPRLRELKAAWDPENVFRNNLNVAPA